MEWIQRWWAQSQAQLAELTVSQKMLIGTLLIVIPITMFVVWQYASAPQMVPVLDQAIEPAKRSQIISYLDNRNINYRTVGDRILVPIANRYDVLSSLSAQQLLPKDTSSGFNALVDKQSWWQSSEQNRQIYNIAKQNVLSQVLQAYPWVSSATVIISMPHNVGFGSTSKKPTASVNVVLANGKLNQKKVDAIAGLVSGAVAEMAPTDVTVIDAVAGRQWKVRDNDEAMPGNYIEIIHNQERYYREKITQALGYISKVIVAVNVEVNMIAKRTDSITYSKEGSVELLVKDQKKTSTITDPKSGGEPGVRANTGADIAATSGGGSSSNTEEGETAFDPHAGKTHEISAQPSGIPTRISATVNVPRSFFTALYMRGKGEDVKEPTDEQLRPIIEANLQRIKKQIEPLVKTKDTGNVVVDVYPDMPMAITGSGGPGTIPAAAGSSMIAGGGYAKPVGLGALALISIAMMLMMIRKASVKPPVPTAAELAGVPPTIRSGDDVIGEVDETDAPLTGVELSDDELQHHKISEQVNEMVKANPSEVASMVKRMINTNE